MLCKRHNNALSPVDSTAGAFLKGILKTPEFLRSEELRLLSLSGDNFERWMLKTLCTHIIVVGKFGKAWEPPLEWLEILWNMKPFPAGCGLYFNHEVGQSTSDVPKLALRVLTCPGVEGATGGVFELGAFRLALAMVPPNRHQICDSVLVPKYYRPSDFVITYGNREVLLSLGWDTPVVPQRIRISWTPNSSSRN